MKKINVRFEQDKTVDSIEIVIRANERDAQITDLMERLAQRESFRLIALDKNECPGVIDEKDIVFLSADGKDVRIVTINGIYRARQSLRSFEETLSRTFLRVSRFEIISLKMVRKYDFTIGGTLRIEFENGMETWASRRYIPLIKERLSQEEGYLC
ncbi:MAG: LytTR family transcriptional regulator DNA-binding domain-containing protein [Ruminococcus sp.]|uniref:LytTR family DNA-binding domain-containing protein n=1 Tax=Lachnoclostridium sp. MSJ-17 TaxID=2841516 RepID=UPI001C128254|nr:LytTR family transcriptional regulator DNA-binding domain-containing protein [Ruminococcus sp.]MBU5461424.1 LytTR family transcriptional regulator DNA-binding domain-containing protein [Lachnoclostridium sp. MSJ-17]